MDTELEPRRGYSGADAPLVVPAGLESLVERLTAAGVRVFRQSVSVESKVPGSIKTGCYFTREVRSVPAVGWKIGDRSFVAFVDARGKVRFRESFREHRPPYVLQSARTEADVLFAEPVPS